MKFTGLSTIKRISIFGILVVFLFHTRGGTFSDRAGTQAPNRKDLARALSSTPGTAPSLGRSSKQGKPFGQIPLYFEVNQGQVDSSVKFIARGGGAAMFLTANEAVFALPTPDFQLLTADFGLRNEDRLSIGDFRLPIGRTTNDATGITNNLGLRSLDLRQRLNPQSEIDNRQSPTRPTTVRHPKSAAIRMKFLGGNPNAQIEGLDRLPGISNYFIGNDPAKWPTNIPHYAKVRYRDVYPGIDLVYQGKSGQMEYDLVISPEADPRIIQIAFEGIEQMQIDTEGDLILNASGNSFHHHKPDIYQDAGKTRKSIAGGYRLLGTNRVGFDLHSYDVAKTLVIDPTITYSTLFGGESRDNARSIAVDFSGNVYLTGDTLSANFPTTAGALQPTYQGIDCGTFGRGPSCGDVFVSKLNPQGDTLLYSTYLGGAAPDGGWAIAVDSQGNAFVSGNARSVTFPTTIGAFQTTGKGGICGVWSSSMQPYPCSDVFVLKLNPQGNNLLYSTLLGGSEDDIVGGMVVDSAGNAYLSGTTGGLDFPVSPGAIQPLLKGGSDAFVVKLNPTGSALTYSTYLGGTGSDQAASIALDSFGNAFLVGTTSSRDFPSTATTVQALAGSSDAFVTKINPTGTALLFSTYLGGTAADSAADIAVDSAGNAYVAGLTRSADFPVTTGAVQPTFGGEVSVIGGDAFVTKLSSGGTSLLYSTFLGGSGDDLATKLALDAGNQVIVVGTTGSLDFPVVKPIQPEKGSYDEIFSPADAFVAKLNSSGTEIIYSTYLGGENDDSASGLALDALGNLYVTGGTWSSRFPGQTLPGRPSTALSLDLFVTKLTQDEIGSVPPALFVPIVLSSQGLNNSFYTTELTLANRSSRDATLSLTYSAAIGEGSGTASIVLRAGRQQIVPDTIAYLRSLGVPLQESGNRGGTLRVEFSIPGIFSYRDVAVTARTTTALPRGRAGLAYSAVPVWQGLTEPAYLFGLRQDEFDRSNVAIQNLGTPSDGEIQLRLTVFSGDPGASVQFTLPLETLQPGGFRQIDQILHSNSLTLSRGYVRVERVSGKAPFYAYAVINDQQTSDGSFIIPIAENSRQGISNGVLIIPAVVETGSYESELVLVNWSSLPKPFQLNYKATAIETPDHTATITVNLDAGEQRIIPNFVQFLRDQGLESVLPTGATFAGPLTIAVQAVDSGEKTQAFVRTLGTEPTARFGVAYAGLTVDKTWANSAWIYGLQQNAENRTNLAIASPFSISINPDLFAIDLYDGETGTKVRSIEGVTISDEGWKQLGSVLSDYAPGTRQGYARIRRISSGSLFYPYAVINDGGAPGERTGDGAFIASSP